MGERFPDSQEVIYWKAVTYHRRGKELILVGRLREAEIYLNKALKTNPDNRELNLDIKRDLERVKNPNKPR
jgi:tetratricopeptide (TPR) repeat protein